MQQHLTYTGRSGAAYDFFIYDGQRSWRGQPGLYAFVRLDLFVAARLFYIGESVCLHSRLANHERWRDAVKKGATHVAIHPTLKPDVRLAAERDLIKGNHPPLNRVHRLRLQEVAPPPGLAEQNYQLYHALR